MAHHLDLEEQEQLDQLKHFWNAWGNLITALLIVVFGALAAWNGYQYWQKRQALQASALLDAVDAAASAHDSAKLQQALGDLQTGYAGTAQAGLAGLMAGKALFEANKSSEAKAALGWVAQKAADAGYQALARLRLAQLLVQDKAYDEALAQLAAAVPPEFEAAVADRKGDIYALQDKKTEAVAAYQKAYQRFDSDLQYRRLVEAKLNALGVNVAATAPGAVQ